MTDSMSSSSERCVLCLDQKRSPVRIQCGHSFCYGCLDVYKSYKKYAWANKCPICRNVLKEKRTTKRKYSEMNAGPAQNITTLPNSNTTLTTNQSIPPEQVCILEEFMALASEYDNNEENDNSNQTYINLDEYESSTAVLDLTEDDDNNYDNDEENEQTDFENDSYDEEFDSYTDSGDDDNDNYYYFEEDEPLDTDVDWESIIGTDVIIID